MNKQKKLTRGIISALLVVMLVAVGCGFISAVAESSPQKAYSSNVDCGPYDEYTNYDEHNGIELRLFSDVYSKSVELKEDQLTTEADRSTQIVRMEILRENDITRFVPKELFKSEGVKTYIGKQYGFLVDTFAVEGSDALHSIVLLFDIEAKNNLTETKDHLIISVSPVFQGEFAYITPQTEKILCAYPGNDVKYSDKHTAPIYVSASADTLVPVPVTSGTVAIPALCNFTQINKYYLKNFMSLANLYNENHLNAFDEEYQVYEDKGAFFTQMDFSYSAHIYKEGKISVASGVKVGIDAVTLGLDILKAALEISNPVVGIVGDIVGLIKDCFKLAGEDVDRLESTEKVLTYVPDYTSAKEQIDNKGYLTKDAVIEVVPNGTEDLVLTTGDNITVDYQVAATDPSWRTRYVLSLVMDAFAVTDEGTETITLSNKGYSDTLDFATADEYTEMENDTDAMLYLLPNGKQYNSVEPAYTGWYTFSTDISGGYYTKIIDETDQLNKKEVETVYDDSNNTYRAYLQAGNSYVWEVGYGDKDIGGVQTCKYMFDPQIMAVGNNTVSFNNSSAEYIQLKFEKNGFYTLSSPDGAAFHVYDDSMQEIESGTEVRVENGGGESVYLSVTFDEAVTKDVTIVCDKEKEVEFVTYTEEEIEGITVENDAPVVLPVPVDRTGYIFIGWWNNSIYEGEAVTGETLSSIDQATVTLYAKWQPIEYDIIYNENGGAEIADGSYTVEDFVRLETDIVKDGYIFKGWYDNAEFTGEPIEHISEGSLGNRTFYAKWVKETYTVSLDENNDYIDQQSADLTLDGAEYAGRTITVNYGEGYRLPVATTRGFVFEGWYSGNEQITDANGNSMRDYTFEQDLEVTAKWRRESYTIKLKMDENHTYWLVEGGLSEDEATIEYTADLCPNCMINKMRSKGNMVLFRDGYIYKWLTTDPNDETELACWAETSKELQDGAEYIVYAYYIPEEYKLYFEQFEGERNNYVFNEVIEYPEFVIEDGVSFDGWFDSVSGEVFEYNVMPDLTSNEEGNGSISLIPHSHYIEYSIQYNLNNGSFQPGESAKQSYNATDSFAILVPYRTGYRFIGWYENSAYSGQAITEILEGTTGDKTLYAKWEKEYAVEIIINDRNNNNLKRITKKYIDGEIITLSNWFDILDMVSDDERYYHYDGEWRVKDSNGNTKKSIALLQSSSAATYVFDSDNVITSIELTWEAQKYNIRYEYLFGARPEIYSYTYGEETKLGKPKTDNLNEFDSYYTDAEFKEPISVISPDQYGDLTLFVKWSHIAADVNLFRPDQVKITDSGRWKQHHDELTVYFDKSKFVGYPAFKSLEIRITFEMKESDDGLQYIMLYDQYSKKDGVGELWSYQINRGSGKQTVYRKYSFTINVPIDDAIYTPNSKKYYILYGASGNWDDDWYNRNLDVKAYLSYDEPTAGI